MSARDSLLKPGQEEAQWCLFDPIVSIIHGCRFRATGDRRDLDRQREALRRSLSQLTPPGSRFGGYRCPESYFLELGEYVPNDITPLLWTQANLRLALTTWSGVWRGCEGERSLLPTRPPRSRHQSLAGNSTIH